MNNFIFIIIWLVLWFGVMGLTNLLFKKRDFSYYKYPFQNLALFILSIFITLWVYRDVVLNYFVDISIGKILLICALFLFWIFVPYIYKNDYFSKRERISYQIPKFFEILFQQICFLGGLLTMGLSPLMFGILFFVVHIPIIFFIPSKFFLFPILGSLAGGIIFAYLQLQGVAGFLLAFFIHLVFWATTHYLFSINRMFGIVPIKR